MDYSSLSVREFLKKSRSGEVDLEDFYQKLFARLEQVQKQYNPFVTLAPEPGLGSLPKGPLHGLPVSAKDCICTEGIQSSAGSRILEGYKPPFDATVIQKVKKAGGVVIGKTQQDEFGFGTFSTNSGFGVPRNPLDPSRSCGGSSGGAAALTRALDFPHIALAESTGGSISCPAAFCGVVGLTPTYGLVSRWGLIDYANSLDKIGVIAREVDDAALMLQEIQGFDPDDFTSLSTLSKGYPLQPRVEGLRIGVPKEYFSGVDDQIEAGVWEAIKALESEGAKVRELSLPHAKLSLAAYYTIATAEASTNLAKYCGMRYGPSLPLQGDFNEHFSAVRTRFLGQEAKRRIMLGTFARLAGYRGKYYLKALQARTLILSDFEKAFRGKGRVDVLISPAMPILPPRFSEIEKLTPLQNYQMDILTVGPNLAGIPHLSIPWGTSRFSAGVHILGDHLQERKVLEAGKALELAGRRHG